MTAALYAARASKRVLLLERDAVGGQILLSQRIENYPALPETDGYSFAEALKGQLLTVGVQIEYAAVTGVEASENAFRVQTDSRTYPCRAVILATGLQHRRLDVRGEAERIGRGVSFCAACDGMLFRNKEVAVVGGGNTAVQDALTLSEICAKVHLIHRRMELRAEHGLVERLQQRDNIVFYGETVIEELLGQGRLEALCLKHLRREERQRLAVSGLFEAIGQIPQNECFRSIVSLDADGYFVTDAACRTSCAGIFAAGDAVQKQVRQLTTAVADGTIAALSAVAYLADQLHGRKGDTL